ncbi:MAG: hypothetical protein GY828_04795 [Candidatus Gracilibacteria bacterium]|nr:hypothetical protein [Candidatus Gracilibacteria bacterium]
MKNAKKAFSLIELIVATSILTLTVFGVLKLIGENTKTISNAQLSSQLNYLLQPTKECLGSIGISTLQAEGTTVYVNIGSPDNPLCLIGNSNTLLTIDGIEYQIKADKISYNTKYIRWNLEVSDNFGGIATMNFLQK